MDTSNTNNSIDHDHGHEGFKRKHSTLTGPEEPLSHLGYVALAAVGGSWLASRTRSVTLKVLAPITFGAVAANYIVPVRSQHWIDQMYGTSRHDVLLTAQEKSHEMRDSLQRAELSTEQATEQLRRETHDTLEGIRDEAQASWDNVRTKAEQLAGSYKATTKAQASNFIDKSLTDTKSWLDNRKATLDRALGGDLDSSPHKTTVASAATAAAEPKQGGGGLWSYFTLSDKSETFGTDITKADDQFWSQQAKAEAEAAKEAVNGDKPKRSFWSFGRSSAEPSPSPHTDGDLKAMKAGDRTAVQEEQAQHSLDKDLEKHDIAPARVRRGSKVDKAVATTAIKYHDETINRGSMVGKNPITLEETARKVHNNVIDAAIPKHMQQSNAEQDVTVTRKAVDGVKSGVKAAKKDLDHGLKNLEQRAHMIHQGVEHYEHKLNGLIQKNLEDEAAFWHNEALKDEQRQAQQANSRGGERAM